MRMFEILVIILVLVWILMIIKLHLEIHETANEIHETAANELESIKECYRRIEEIIRIGEVLNVLRLDTKKTIVD